MDFPTVHDGGNSPSIHPSPTQHKTIKYHGSFGSDEFRSGSLPVMHEGPVPGMVSDHSKPDGTGKLTNQAANMTEIPITREQLMEDLADTHKQISELEELVKDLRVERDQLAEGYPLPDVQDPQITALLETIPDGIIIANMIGTVQAVNSSLCTMIGIPREEIVGRSAGTLARTFLSGTHLSQVLKIIPSNLSGNSIKPFEIAFWDRTLEISASINRRTRLSTGIIRDITERKRLEEAHQASEATKEAILNALPDLMFRLSRDGVHLDYYASKPEELYAQPEDFIGKTVDEILPADVASAFRTNIQRSLETRDIQVFEYPLELPEIGLSFFEARMVVSGENEVLTIVRNITERRTQELAHHISENRYRAIFENTGTAMVIFEQDTTVQYMNRKAEELCGFSMEEVVGKKSWTEFIIEEDLQFMKEYFGLRLKDPVSVPHNYEFRFRNKDGDIKDIFLTIGAIPETTQFVASLMDITRRKRSETALRESENTFRLAMEATQFGLWDWDIPTGSVYFSPHWADILELKEFESKYATWTSRIHHEDRDSVVSSLTAHLEGSSDLWSEEHRLITESGEWKWVLGRGQVVQRDSDDAPIRMIGTMIDITEQKEIEEALWESRRSAERYLGLVAEIIISLDRQGTITLLNSSGHALLGYDDGELIGRNWFETCLPVRTRDEVRTIYAELMKGNIENVQSYENPVLMKSGKERIIRWYNTILQDDGGSIFGLLSSGEDITQIRKTEEALRESEGKFRAAIEQSADNIYIMDIDTMNFIDSSPSLQLSLGYSSEEMSNLTAYDFIDHPREDIDRKLELIMENGQAFIGERQYRRKDGTQFDVEVNGSIITYGGKTALCVVSRDITERKKINQELRESQERFRSLTDLLPESIFEADLDLQITFANQRAFETFGYTREDFDNGLNAMNMIVPEDRERVQNNMRDRVSGNEIGLKEYSALRKDGSTFPILYHASLIFKDRRPIGIRGLLIDITNLKEAEKALRESEERYRGYIDHAPHGVFVTDPEGNYLDVNEAACRITGYSRDEILSMNVAEFSPPELQGSARDRYKMFLRSGSLTSTVPFVRKDGSQGWWRIDATALPGGTFLGFTTDISLQKEAEERVLRSLEEKELLLKEVHHRVKNNMQIISSLLDLQADAVDDAGFSELLNVSQKRIKTMALIHEELYSSKTFGSIDAGEYIGQLTDYLSSMNPDLSVDPSITLLIDDINLPIDTAIPLGLIITECVTNSQKYAFSDHHGQGEGHGEMMNSVHEDPQILIKLVAGSTNDPGEEDVGATRDPSDGNIFTLCISDNGIGLSPDIDFRNSDTLGLQLISMLVEQLKGTMEIDCSEGTSFCITFFARDTSTIPVSSDPV